MADNINNDYMSHDDLYTYINENITNFSQITDITNNKVDTVDKL